ncbi:MAG TPA: hypothetical protein VLI44_03915, partial [Sporolactobacillaceae bacterium]|nr:hypothetical protein [Sporolactobacillaceae bacterium]
VAWNYLRDCRINGVGASSKLDFDGALKSCDRITRGLDATHISQAGLHDRFAALGLVEVREHVIIAEDELSGALILYHRSKRPAEANRVMMKERVDISARNAQLNRATPHDVGVAIERASQRRYGPDRKPANR